MLPGLELDIQWHLIGHLQRNKAKNAVDLFNVVETLDSTRLAQELDKRCAQAGKVLPVMIEVNSGREEKQGRRPAGGSGRDGKLVGKPGAPAFVRSDDHGPANR